MAKNSINQFIVATESNLTITMNITADRNKWAKVWDSIGFFIYFRLFIVILNAIGIILAFRVMFLHYIRFRMIAKVRPGQRSDDQIFFILNGLFFELASVTFRCVYCGIGPIMSSNSITSAVNIYLISFSGSFEVMATLMATNLFVKWGAFGTLTDKKSRIVQNILLAIGFFAIGLRLLLCYQQNYNRPESLNVGNLDVFLILIVFVVTSTLFFYYGIKLARKLSKQITNVSSDVASQRARHIKKAVLWIIAGGSFQIIQILAYLIAIDSEFLWSPIGWAVFWGIFYFGSTMNAILTIQAFKPLGYSLPKPVFLKKAIKNAKRMSRSADAFFAPEMMPSGSQKVTIAPVS
eukprot:c5526_g1_i1.p1 GENE.c5526_g1_i1~~c5526_g1_i1.p1  ORF type:complete len:350 (-),score=111.33 c5526_g1_i1:45-1094(-)